MIISLNKKEKWLIRRVVFIFILATLLAIPSILVNDFYFIEKLGWQSIAFPLILSITLILVMFVYAKISDRGTP